MNSFTLDHQKFAASLDEGSPGVGGLWLFGQERLRPLESPLEATFLGLWMLATYDANSCSYEGQMYLAGERIFDLSSQHRMSNMRVDFLIRLFSDDGEAIATAAIETDGFTYHGDQHSFESDRERDQFLLSRGIACFRFTKRTLHIPRPLGHIISWAERYRPVRHLFSDGEALPAPGPSPLADIGKRTVETHIWDARPDPTEMKIRVMKAWEDGHLSDDEAEGWIVAWGLEAA